MSISEKTTLSPGVSILVCCYNARERIEATLRHLFNQVCAPDLAMEIVLVDNNSSDGTSAHAVHVEKQHNQEKIPFRIVHEPQQGLAKARRAGVFSACYDALIFCDDDNWLSSNYVQNAFEEMTAHPEIGMLGGAIVPASESPLPAWFYSYAPYYAVGAQALQSGDITSRGYVWGAGCVLRTAFLRHMFTQLSESLLMGRSGNNLGAGDDSEIAKWVVLSGQRLWYDESLVLTHYMPEIRLQKTYLQNMLAGGKPSVEVLRAYDFLIQAQTTAATSLARKVYAWAINRVSYSRLQSTERALLQSACAVAREYQRR